MGRKDILLWKHRVETDWIRNSQAVSEASVFVEMVGGWDWMSAESNQTMSESRGETTLTDTETRGTKWMDVCL